MKVLTNCNSVANHCKSTVHYLRSILRNKYKRIGQGNLWVLYRYLNWTKLIMAYYQTLMTLLSLAIVSHAAYNYLVKKKKRRNDNEIHEVLMFSYGVEEIKKSKYSRCMITKSMDRLLHYLSLPKYKFDVCMYVLTNTDITNALLKLHYRSVKIRIIVDADMAFSCGSGIKKLIRHGIPVRWIKSTNLMHHKFCLADTQCTNGQVTPFLMTGSLNWTNQALCGNYEDYLVTSQKELVQQYQDEFERLWILFKPIVT